MSSSATKTPFVNNVAPEVEATEETAENEPEESVAVCVRIRPLLHTEAGHSTGRVVIDKTANEPIVRVQVPGRKEEEHAPREKQFTFDFLLDAQADQLALFEQVGAQRLVEKFVDGYNCTVFAYGQTGSGKTYTMEGLGSPDDCNGLGECAGLMPRCVVSVFNMLEKQKPKQRSYRVRCSFVQIYNEVVYDLLQPGDVARKGKWDTHPHPSQGLRMRYNNVDGFYLENLAVFECGTAEEALQHLQHGVKYKHMGSHKLNEKSSRSHCLFTLYLESNDAETNTSSCSKLTLVDLAGSERVSVTGATGKTFIEATHINTSLFVLRTVIASLAQSQESDAPMYVPYRDSKLTSLLQNCIGGDAYTLMIACIAPSDDHYLENLSTLSYAAKANTIRSKPIRIEDAKSKTIRLLREEIRLLKKQLQVAQKMNLLRQHTLGARSAESKRGREPEPTADPATTRLKERLLDSIELIKNMHSLEKDLRSRMERAEESLSRKTAENQRLLSENQTIREHEDMLMQLLETNDSKGTSKSSNSSSIVKELKLLRAQNAELKDRIQVLGTVQTENKPHEPSQRPRVPRAAKPSSLPRVRQSQIATKPAATSTTIPGLGHLSINQLRDLLKAKPKNQKQQR